MTAPVRHTKKEIETAAKAARENDLTTRLEADGTIVFIPNPQGRSKETIAKSDKDQHLPKEWPSGG